MNHYNCFDCSKVIPLMNEPEDKCPSCGGGNGQVVDSNRLKEGLDSGAFYNIDLRTGKREKPKK